MSRNHKVRVIDSDDHNDLSILEAVENLSSLAELGVNDRLGVVEDHLIIQHSEEEEQNSPLEGIQWLEEKNQHKTEVVVEDTFKAVLKYVKDFHTKDFNRFYDPKSQEGIKKMMLLVGKATDNLKNFTHLFEGVHRNGVEELDEYQQLTKFYKERIAVEDQEKVSLIDLSRKERQLESIKHPVEEEDEDFQRAKQFILDIDKIKHDDSYELLYLERDDGSRFYNQNFIRNLKLACNFSNFLGRESLRDPLEGLMGWYDHSLSLSAKNILKEIKPYLKNFYQEAMRYRDMEIVSTISMAVMALMMASNTKNQLQFSPIKCSTAYYVDFQYYLRSALSSFEYQKLKDFPPPSSHIFLTSILDIVHILSWSLFFQKMDQQSLGSVLDDIFEEGKVAVNKKDKHASHALPILESLQTHYLHVSRYLMNYPVGPLYQTLKIMQENDLDRFDTLMMQNLPFEWQKLKIDHKAISMLRLPSPTRQERVTKVEIDPEFMGMLDGFKNSKEKKNHLIINTQDRTVWKERPRAKFLETLPKNGQYLENINVVTFCKDSDFYNQSGAYQDLSSAGHFFKQIVFQLHSEESGFYFPQWIEEKVFNGFIEKLIQQVHRFFFESKSSLTQKERQDFIEIVYQFLTLKLIEITNCDSFSITCKDGLDVSSTASCQLYMFIKLLQGKHFTKEDQEKINLLLFALPVLVRQRPANAMRFNRMIQCTARIQKALEKHSKENIIDQVQHSFGPLYQFSLKNINFN